MIHHVTYEIDKAKVAQELAFWSCLGFNPTGLRRRSRKQPPIHWILCGDEGHAIELLPVEKPATWGLGHVCYALDQREWEIAWKQVKNFEIEHEVASNHFGHRRLFLHSPSGHPVEVIQGRVSLKAGPPLEES